MRDTPLSRRRFLSSSALLSSAAAAGTLATAACARTIKGDVASSEGEAAAPPDAAGATRYVYFTPAEAALVEAAVARLIPADDRGPGALEAGCAHFIDLQLAGPFGRGDSWYMQGPWSSGDATQGYQSRLAPADLYRAALGATDEHCRQSLGGKRFAELSQEQQDQVLSDLETGKIELQGVDGKLFFETLLQNTVEGFFADPVYGGNRDMAGWQLIGYPGARYDYSDYVAKHGEKFPLPPVGLRGRKEWSL